MIDTVRLILIIGGVFFGIAGLLLCIMGGMSVERQMGHMDIDTYRRTGLGIKLIIIGLILGVIRFFLR